MSGKQPEYRQKQERAAQERKEAQHNADREQIVSALQRIAEQNKATDNQAKRADRFHRLVEKLSLRLEGRKYWIEIAETAGLWVAAAVGVIAVIISSSDSHRQLEALRGQLDEMKDDRRAWVGVVEAVMAEPPAAGKPVHAAVSYSNSGRSPAFNLHSSQRMLRVAINDGSTPNDWTAEIPANSTCGVIQGATSGGSQTIFPGAAYNTGIPPSQNNAYTPDITGIKALLIWQGCFTYETLGKFHRTNWCLLLRPFAGGPIEQWHWQFCQVGNTAD